ncbi:hypothetical protein Z043_101229 [Scleropages formosus]|uniref:Uncharacterized protein n=1 Tax=Scleropages formosus TaxID=113540 RepID=A0A0P7XQM4_SCLFO|nr:hypothetical protein Z043_101229 [Scleropages formosus]
MVMWVERCDNAVAGILFRSLFAVPPAAPEPLLLHSRAPRGDTGRQDGVPGVPGEGPTTPPSEHDDEDNSLGYTVTDVQDQRAYPNRPSRSKETFDECLSTAVCSLAECLLVSVRERVLTSCDASKPACKWKTHLLNPTGPSQEPARPAKTFTHPELARRHY